MPRQLLDVVHHRAVAFRKEIEFHNLDRTRMAGAMLRYGLTTLSLSLTWSRLNPLNHPRDGVETS